MSFNVSGQFFNILKHRTHVPLDKKAISFYHVAPYKIFTLFANTCCHYKPQKSCKTIKESF